MDDLNATCALHSLTDDDDRFILFRTAAYMDKGYDVTDAKRMAQTDLLECLAKKRRDYLEADVKRARRLAIGLKVVAGKDVA